jgi:cytochrome oxidase Cu insertion factor (SCO1/SenC/PrrC family)
LVPEVVARTIDGEPYRVVDTRGRWLLVRVGSGRCDEACVKQLFFLRQVRLMQGREMDRVHRLWLLSDPVKPERSLVEAYAGMVVLQEAPTLLGAFSGAGDPAGSIYVVDPEGRVMLRFPPGADPMKAAKDLARLLKVSHIG